MFGHRKKVHRTYDDENEEPVVRCSICTGEQVAGFRNLHTGKFTESMLIRDEKDLEAFKDLYGISTIKKIY